MNEKTTQAEDPKHVHMERVLSTDTHHYKVYFNGTTVTPEVTTINADQNCNIIEFKLDPSSSLPGTAVFNNPPIQWIVNGSVQDDLPEYVACALRSSNLKFLISDLNTIAQGGNNISFQFYIGVAYTPTGGTPTTIWSPDPTIVNTPIT